MRRQRIGSAGIALLAACALASGRTAASSSTAPGEADRVLAFHREVVNLEAFSGALRESVPPGLTTGPPFAGDVWYGEIPRQLPGDALSSRAHNVPFAVIFAGANVVRARADVNLNGDLSDDADAKLSLFPDEPPARSFLVALRWVARRGAADTRLERLVRVVVEPAGVGRAYRTHDVYGMLGSLDVDGHPRLAVLFDANQDGFYTKGSGDGVFFDLDGDRHFLIDVMAPDFGSFARPFTLGRQEVTATEVDPLGASVSLRSLGAATPIPPLTVGRPVPDFAYVDTDGRLLLLSAQRGKAIVVYFWASSWGACRDEAGALRAMVERYAPEAVEFLGVSYDSDREAMERFRHEHGQTWPTSFSGGIPADDPVGRVFRESRPGVFYVIDREGRFVATTDDLGVLNDHLAALAQGAAPSRTRGT